MLGLLLLALLCSVFGLSYTTLLPAFIDKILHQGAEGYGWLNTATGLGAVSGALLIAHFGERSRQRGRWMAWACVGFPIVLLLFANNVDFTVSLALGYGLGLFFMIQFTLINTLLQTHVDDHMRGRVLSLYTLTFFGLAPFGNLAIGSLAEVWGLSLVISLSAMIALVLQSVVLVAIPQVRKLP
jgi:MFS family permease